MDVWLNNFAQLVGIYATSSKICVTSGDKDFTTMYNLFRSKKISLLGTQ